MDREWPLEYWVPTFRSWIGEQWGENEEPPDLFSCGIWSAFCSKVTVTQALTTFLGTTTLHLAQGEPVTEEGREHLASGGVATLAGVIGRPRRMRLHDWGGSCRQEETTQQEIEEEDKDGSDPVIYWEAEKKKRNVLKVTIIKHESDHEKLNTRKLMK